MPRVPHWLFLGGCLLTLRAQEPVPPPAAVGPVPPPRSALGSLSGDFEAIEAPSQVDIDTQGGIHRDPASGLLRFEGPVKLRGDQGLEVFADRAVLDENRKTVTLQGKVSVYQGGTLQRGEQVVYHYEQRRLDTSGLRLSVEPLLLEAGSFQVETRDGKRVYEGRDAGITTHDDEDPNFWIRAGETTVYPGEKVVFRDMTVHAAGVPVFWLPYLSQPLDGELGYHFLPGARSNWGGYLLNSYGILLGGRRDPVTGENEDAWLLSRWRFDLRSRRGVGLGVDLLDTRQTANPNLTGLSLYYLNDLDPSIRRTGVPRGVVNEDRYRIDLAQRHELPFGRPGAAYWLDANLTLLSDDFYLDDFEPMLFRSDPAPDNTLAMYRRDEVSLFTALARLRVNDFYRTDTRLPELSFDMVRRPLFNDLLMHEGQTAFGILGGQMADPLRANVVEPLLALPPGAPQSASLLRQLNGFERQLAREIIALPPGDPRRAALTQQLLDPSFWRFHTYQEFSAPLQAGRLIALNPQAGLGFTRYGAVDGPVDDFNRLHLHAGIEASALFHKDLPGFRIDSLGVNGLLHILQPYANWSLLSSDDPEAGFLGVDRLTPTTRPRPLDPSRFTAIDGMRSWNILRFGARNRLLTRRDGQGHDWLLWNSYMDAFLEDPEAKRDFSNWYNEFRWHPVPWVALDAETQFPLLAGGSGFTEFSTRARFMPNEETEVAFGYRFLDGHPELIDSSQLDLQFYRRINENWGIGTRHLIEMDDGTLEAQHYSLHRNLGNWVAGVGFTHRDNRLREEIGVMFSLSLKDFQSATLPFRLDAQ